MIDIDFENIHPIPESKLKLVEITNVSKIRIENKTMKVMFIVLSCSVLIYGITHFFKNIKNAEKRK